MILDIMFCVALDTVTKNNSDDNRGEKNNQEEPTRTTDGIGLAFEGLFDDYDNDDDDDDDDNGADTTENSIRIRCRHQLDAYELTVSMKMRDNGEILTTR